MYEAVERPSRECCLPITVNGIIDSICKSNRCVWRCHFLLNGDDAQRVVRRDLDRLERDGLVRTWRGKRGVRCIGLAENGCTGAMLPAAVSLSAIKPWQIDGISRATWYRRRRGTDPDTGTPVVSPDILPETLDLSMFPACERRETAASADIESTTDTNQGEKPQDNVREATTPEGCLTVLRKPWP